MPYWDELRHNDPDEIDGVDDVVLPTTMHHMQAQAELDLLVSKGAITDTEAEEAIRRWKARKEVGSGDRIAAAIDILLDHELIDEERATELREAAAG